MFPLLFVMQHSPNPHNCPINLVVFPSPMKSFSVSFSALLLAFALRSLASNASAADSASNAYTPLAYHPLGTYGQALVDVEIAKHPELKILTVHVTPPGVSPDKDGDRRLMFSNIGRIGKVDNAEDDAVFRGGKEVVEIQKTPAPKSTNFSITATPKYEVIDLLKDKSGKNIGLIVMVFPYHAGALLDTYHQVAQQVTAELNGKVSDKEELLAPAP
jgi:hypothetical protein